MGTVVHRTTPPASATGSPPLPSMDEELKLIGMIADEDTLVGFLLCSIGDVGDGRGQNFLCVDGNTPVAQIEAKFDQLTKREDVAMIMINQWIAEKIEHVVKGYNQIIPTIIVIPSKDKPYDSSKDEIFTRIKRLMGVRH